MSFCENSICAKNIDINQRLAVSQNDFMIDLTRKFDSNQRAPQKTPICLENRTILALFSQSFIFSSISPYLKQRDY